MTKLTDYVTIAAAAEILGVSQNTLRKWADRGDIPMRCNPSGYRLFKLSELDKFLELIERTTADIVSVPQVADDL